jgi:signal transduction histidine kinase
VRRLGTQIHLTILVALALFAVLAAAAWLHGPGLREDMRMAGALTDTIAELLPGTDRPREELQAEVARLAERFDLSVTVFSSSGERLASFGEPLPFPRFRRGTHVSLGRARFDIALWLRDGRVLVAARPHPGLRHYGRAAFALGLLALAVFLASWPLVRRLTRRLENLRRRVEALGGGDLAARAPVEGRDEVADLARSFNRAAERIQALVEAQRRQLAFASHELRSPLARLRVSLEMMAGDPSLKAQAARDIAELDGLIDELLEASRLEAQRGPGRVEDIDLLALAAEEAARGGADAEGDAVVLRGDARLLRRLVRNLIENAARHGEGAPIEVRLARLPEGGARLSVLDRGPGVSEAERERVFEPFHRPPGAPETGSGYGLGLALVRQIARAHGGDVRCLPRDGGGSVFEVDLPAGSPSTGEAGGAKRA